MPRLSARPGGPVRGERPDRPFTGYKLAYAVLSADGTRTGFVGLTMGATRVYGAVAGASCVWNGRHEPPRRWCGCGFYCLHDLADARALGCATENRAALLLEVAASGRYIRYQRGLRFSRQRVRAIMDSRCGCGDQGTALADAGTGIVGWRHLVPVCARCLDGRRALTLAGFTALLGGQARVALPRIGQPPPVQPPPVQPPPVEPAPSAGAPGTAESREAPGLPGTPADPGASPFAVLAAEIALLHARLDDLQSRLDR